MSPEPIRERLPVERESRTHKFRVGQYEGYITAGEYEDGRLGEVFLTDMGKEGSFAAGVLGTWAMTFSVALQYGVPLDNLLRKYANIRFEAGPTGNPLIPEAASVVDYIARWLALRYGSIELKQELRLPVVGMRGGPADELPVELGGPAVTDEEKDPQQEAVDQESQRQVEAAEGGHQDGEKKGEHGGQETREGGE